MDDEKKVVKLVQPGARQRTHVQEVLARASEEEMHCVIVVGRNLETGGIHVKMTEPMDEVVALGLLDVVKRHIFSRMYTVEK